MDDYREETIDISTVPPKHVFYLFECVKILTKMSLDNLISFSVEYADNNYINLRYKRNNDENIYNKMLFRCKLKELFNKSEVDILKSIKNIDDERYDKLEDEIMLEYENCDDPNYSKKKKRFLKHKYEFIFYNNFPIDPNTKNAFKDAIKRCILNIGHLVLNNIKFSNNQSDYDFLCYNIRNIYIKEISITHSKIEDKGFKYLCRNFINTPHLHNLHITYDYISDNGIKYFMEYSSNITELTRLDLKSNFITDEGMKYLCDSLTNISQLEYLRLVDNECITDEGIKTLVQYFKFIPELQVLEIYPNDITEDGAELLEDAIEKLPKFQSIIDFSIYSVIEVDNAIPFSGLLNSIDENDAYDMYL